MKETGKPLDVGDRPPVGEFDPRHTSLWDYARRNAALAGIDQEENKYNGLLRMVRDLDVTYGSYLRGIHIHRPDVTKYGFSKDHPKTIFQWNMDEVSQIASDDLLYVMNAVPSTEPIQYDVGNGVMRTRQEYSSSTGLSFIDVRDAVLNETPRTNYHEMYVYLPSEE
jgi:hypothetical protein